MLLRNPFTHDSRVEKEAASLVRAGHDVTVVAEWAPGLPVREERQGYRVVRVRRGAARLPGLRLLQYRRRLIRALRMTAPEVIHAHDSDALEPVAAVARQRRVPYVYDAHELWTDQENRGRTELYFRLWRFYYRAIQRLLVPRAASVVTVSPPIAAELRRRYRLREVALVPNYPEISGPLEARSIRDLAAASGRPISDGSAIVLFIGGVHLGRGIDDIVRAIAAVPATAGVFLGSGEPPEHVRSLAEALGIEDRLHFLPRVGSSEVIPFAASADVGITLTEPISLNSRYALPNKLFQYMAAGIPVIASDYPQVAEIVLAHRAGLTVDPADGQAIANAVRAVVADPRAAREMGRRGREAVERAYNWEVAARTLVAVYDRIGRREST